MPKSRRLHAYVSGRVQGVAFRWHAVQEAHRLALTGLVRNLEDGRVELIAEGAQQHLDAMLAWAQHGSPGSRVEHVSYEFEPATSEYAQFVALR